MTRVWIPGHPALRGTRAVRDFAELVRAWCEEEGLRPGGRVRVVVHLCPDESGSRVPPSPERVQTAVEMGSGCEVVEVATVVDVQRVGLEIIEVIDVSKVLRPDADAVRRAAPGPRGSGG
jgi:hypothetical protein